MPSEPSEFPRRPLLGSWVNKEQVVAWKWVVLVVGRGSSNVMTFSGKNRGPCLSLEELAACAVDCGITLMNVDVAYETYGTLNASRSNAVLVLHAFTGDAHAAGIHKESGQPGWWSSMIGPGQAFDTDRYFVISTNVLGGCRGTTGPGSIDTSTGEPYAMRFPVITIADMVRLQKLVVEQLGISHLLAVAGGSMGGMQALQWAAAYPDFVSAAIPIATTSRHSAQQIAFNEVGRQAIMADPDWNNGNYYHLKAPARPHVRNLDFGRRYPACARARGRGRSAARESTREPGAPFPPGRPQ